MAANKCKIGRFVLLRLIGFQSIPRLGRSAWAKVGQQIQTGKMQTGMRHGGRFGFVCIRDPEDTVWDTFCGQGVLSILLASRCELKADELATKMLKVCGPQQTNGN